MIKNKGFSLLEILTVIAILGILVAISVAVTTKAKNKQELTTEVDRLHTALDAARLDALDCRGSSGVGIKFSSTSFESFIGSSYNSGPLNRIGNLSSRYFISTSLPSEVIFSRLTGKPSATGTIYIIDSLDTTRSKAVRIGDEGEIDMIQ